MLSPAGVRETSAWSLLFPFGSPNTTGAGANCYAAQGVIAPALLSGVWKLDTFADLERTELVVVWGTNPANASPPLAMAGIRRARARGAQVLVVDHRRTETVRAADARWLAVRPGTDGALALAMIQVLIEERLYDRRFVEDWTVGFEELAAYVREFSPERAEAITRVPAAEIRDAARRIGRARGACLLHDTGLEYTNSAVQNVRAVLILFALAGHFDSPGGNVISIPPWSFQVNRSRRVSAPAGKTRSGPNATRCTRGTATKPRPWSCPGLSWKENPTRSGPCWFSGPRCSPPTRSRSCGAAPWPPWISCWSWTACPPRRPCSPTSCCRRPPPSSTAATSCRGGT